jgi:hypothetical protein
MRVSAVFLYLLLLSGCNHIGLLFKPPTTLKAIIQGEIKGINIHCEKTLTLGNLSWEVMCKVNDKIDIKYRSQSIDNKQTKLEIVIDKQGKENKKIIMAPTFIVSKNKAATLETMIEKGRIAIKTEPLR